MADGNYALEADWPFHSFQFNGTLPLKAANLALCLNDGKNVQIMPSKKIIFTCCVTENR